MSVEKESVRGSAEMIASMVIAGTVGWFVVMADQAPQVVVFWRCVFGALTMLMICFARRLFKTLTLDKGVLLFLLIGGVALALNWVFLFKAYTLSSIAIATITYHTEPFILVAFGVFLFKEKINLDKILWLICAFVGTVLIIAGKQGGAASQGDTYIWGVLYAILAAFFYACAAIITKKLKHIPPHIIVVFQLFVGALVLLPMTSLEEVANISMASWSYLAIIGVVHTGLMCLLLYSAIQKISTTLVGALSFIYPVVSVLVDWLAFGNTLSVTQMGGSVAILVAAAGVNLGWKLTRKPALEQQAVD